MAATSRTSLTTLSFLISLSTIPRTLTSPLIQELNQPPPPDFAAAVAANCARDPTLRYCNSTSSDLVNIYKSTVVARHLCAESGNPDCNLSFPAINLRSRPKIAPLYLSFAFFWSYCPSSVLAIDLANNSLRGAFPSSVLCCTQIRSLDLSHNALAGDVPFDLLASLANLSFLNLSYNDFSESREGSIGLFERFNSSSFIRSGLSPEDHRHEFEITATILLLMVVLATVVAVFGVIVWLLLRRPHQFTAAVLKKATDGFAEDNVVMNTEKEDVYLGKLRNGVQVEVHVQKWKDSMEIDREFGEEFRVLVQLRHKNLVKVIGWCERRELVAFVMEIAHVCSVEEWLKDSPPWKERLKVLMGVINGICYLEEQWPHVGYDLKTKSLLLTEDIEALISKFRVGNPDSESKKVHKLALLILELVANKRQQEAATEAGESGYIKWVKMHYPVHFKKVIDEKMKLTSCSLEQVKKITDIAFESISVPAEALPSMSQVSRRLRKTCAAGAVHSHHQALNYKHSRSGLHAERARHVER
ncbi:putative LRR receptor-like serine/threonine-protein kinase [Canna indica]|uniref:LRR receptor-like serine/threonine-protein kinase n=1 Tax=Canna indica TaxID=4628 RepID=A0AAQ3L5A4_9LILI|nr:putative LRR receptor-like serine/threonine-protein kinase [Canna indica]